jgi:hypothetical protein
MSKSRRKIEGWKQRRSNKVKSVYMSNINKVSQKQKREDDHTLQHDCRRHVLDIPQFSPGCSTTLRPVYLPSHLLSLPWYLSVLALGTYAPHLQGAAQ